MAFDIAVLLTLILINGALAMSELAIVNARRTRLMELAENGGSGARRALALASEPTRFLSTVQVGITAIGILSGAIGEATIAARLRPLFETVPVLADHADALSIGLMVVTLTYVSLILGELVPKRLALGRPESIAAVMAAPMQGLAAAAKPVVWVLTRSTDAILALIGGRTSREPAVTHDEIKVMLDQGAQEGVFEQSERDMMTNVLELDERTVASALTPRTDVVFLDVRDSAARMAEILRTSPHSVLPLCDGGLDHVIGFVRASRLLGSSVGRGEFDLAAVAEPAQFVPPSMNLMRLLQQFKSSHLPLALVVDEHGGIDGLVSLTDVVSAIVGDLPTEPGEEPAIVNRPDGSWLIDGAADIDTIERALALTIAPPEEQARDYHTVGGLAMTVLGRIPRTGDVFDSGDVHFEVVDMDGNRVDRVLASKRT